MKKNCGDTPSATLKLLCMCNAVSQNYENRPTYFF